MNKSVLTVLRHSQWPIMFGIAFSGAGLRATGRAFRYIQPTLGNTQWTGPACWPAQCLHSASKSSKSKWYQEEFAKLSFCRSGMGTSACEVSCNDESRWESKSRSHGKRWAKRFERKQLEVYVFLCLWILWRWTQHLPSTSKYYKYFFVNRIYESFQSLQTRLTNLPTKGDLWSFCESPEESHHTPANTSCFSWRVTSLTRLACRIIPGPCHTRFFPPLDPDGGEIMNWVRWRCELCTLGPPFGST